MPTTINPEEATAHVFEHWDDPGFPHAIRKLQDKFFGAGSDKTWKILNWQ